MRLYSFVAENRPRFGALSARGLIDLPAAHAYAKNGPSDAGAMPASMAGFLADVDIWDPVARNLIAQVETGEIPERDVVFNPDSVSLLPPLPRPTKVICVARNYAEHAKEAGLELPEMPILFPRFANTLIASGDTINVPTVSHQVDWEGELAVIIGRATHGRINKADAMDYVYGYSIFNDISVRDFQFRVTQYTGGKNFRTSGPFGPCLVTADEIADPHALQITTRLNGEVMQSANTAEMIFSIPTILEHIAEFIDLEPGDVIPTGTPAGVGFKRSPPMFLKDGDVVEVEIPGLGVLRNPVADE